MMRLIIALTALGLAVAPAAFAQETESALPVIKDGQCYSTANEATPAQDQSKCREALGMQGNQDNTTTGSTNPIVPTLPATPNP